MIQRMLLLPMLLLTALANTACAESSASEEKRPNILVIWGDDVGMWNISAYHRGMMGGTTPNIDRIAALKNLTIPVLIADHDHPPGTGCLVRGPRGIPASIGDTLPS